MSLKVSYKDAMCDGPRKYRLSTNPDGTTGITDLTSYTQEGDKFGANDMNATNTAVNQLADTEVPALKRSVGNLTDVELPALKKSVSDGKAQLAAAITLKRVATAATDSFSRMAENIRKIILGSGNAQPADVLAGKTATNDSGVEFVGTMPERGSKSVALGINGSQDLPGGHYGGIHIGQSVPVFEGQSVTPQTYAQTVATSGKYGTGNVNVAAVALPPADAIKRGYRYWIGSNYVDGTYVYSDVTGYYYQAPNEMTGVTGGWVWIAPSDQKPDPGKLSRLSDCMEIDMNPGYWTGESGGTSSGSNSVRCFLCTAKKIDVTHVRTIRLPFYEDSYGSDRTYLMLANEIPDSARWLNSVLEASREPATGKELELDTSNMTGSYYLIVLINAFYGSVTGSRHNKTRFSEIRYDTMA